MFKETNVVETWFFKSLRGGYWCHETRSLCFLASLSFCAISRLKGISQLQALQLDLGLVYDTQKSVIIYFPCGSIRLKRDWILAVVTILNQGDIRPFFQFWLWSNNAFRNVCWCGVISRSFSYGTMHSLLMKWVHIMVKV